MTSRSSQNTGNIVLEFDSLSAGYNFHPLHAPFSFSVRKGEFVSLIGANGAGKSTILKTLIKEFPHISGAIFLDKKNLKDFSTKELSKKMSALLTVSVKPELLTCRDVVASGRYPYTGHFGLLTDDDNAKIDEALSVVKADDFANQDFMKVSDGQKQRILFARALCQSPSVLVLDEPTSYLDIRWRFELFSILTDLCKKGCTIIASLHEIDLALRFSDRVLCVGHGAVKELPVDENACKTEILRLYDLQDDFFKKEPYYSDLVRNFCKKREVAPAVPSSLGNASVMVQGTMSNVGKSFIVAGLCRIFSQDGFSVAPFKSQNMALNSFVTNEGLEMGRAQVMQAEAAGVEPSVLMNPILLKPMSDTGSQVIVNGEVIGTMAAKEYFSFKKSLVPQIKSAYNTLAAEHQIIVIEGAGSPAEINLKENDIVNMGMAQIADSPVLLVADIDRGGVFAQLYGTIELLEKDERARIKGLIINKFRGDKSILDSGIKMIEEKTGIPVVGTVPYLNIQLDDEDSLSENLHTFTKFRDKADEIQIAIVRLPHISNFTDFIPLQNHGAVNVYYVQSPEDFGVPDCVIVPGTKNTLDDLEWLKKTGCAEFIQKEAEKGTVIVGVCGGFQILGKKITGSETEGSSECALDALGLLPVETEFYAKKTRTRVSGKVEISDVLQNLRISGYEIHQGQTRFLDQNEASYFAKITDSVTGQVKYDGAVKGSVFGTYIHGLFDESEFTNQFMQILAERKGFDLQKNDGYAKKSLTLHDFKETQYNLLADTLRTHLDMKKIYKIMGIS